MNLMKLRRACKIVTTATIVLDQCDRSETNTKERAECDKEKKEPIKLTRQIAGSTFIKKRKTEIKM